MIYEVNVYYTDTDSIHLSEIEAKKLINNEIKPSSTVTIDYIDEHFTINSEKKTN